MYRIYYAVDLEIDELRIREMAEVGMKSGEFDDVAEVAIWLHDSPFPREVRRFTVAEFLGLLGFKSKVSTNAALVERVKALELAGGNWLRARHSDKLLALSLTIQGEYLDELNRASAQLEAALEAASA